MVNRLFLKVPDVVVNYTQVDVSKELSSDISNFLMLSMEINGVFVKFGLSLTHFHIVNTTAVISQGFSMHVTNSFADLQEFLVLFDSLFELAKVIIEYTGRIVSTAFITRFSSSFASES